MSVNDWVNLLAAVVGMFGILTPYISSYGRSRSFVGKTKRIKELVSARTELAEILARKKADEQFPSPEYLGQIIESINIELKNLERRQGAGLFIAFCTTEVGLFFLLTFSRLSNVLSNRILGPVGEGGYGFWEGVLEPVAFRIVLLLFLSIVSMSVTLKLGGLLGDRLSKNYYQSNIILIFLFNVVAMTVFFSAWWALVWIDRLTHWL